MILVIHSVENVIKIMGIPRVIEDEETIDEFITRIQHIAISHPQYVHTEIIVLPEYAWGRSTLNIESILERVRKWKNHPSLILGTGLYDQMGEIYNCAIVISRDNTLHLIPKKNPLKFEREQGKVMRGESKERLRGNVLILDKWKVGIIICADMWDHDLIKEIVAENIDLLICPAMTITQPGLRQYAKYQWYSLGITRSREFVIPICVVDNPTESEKHETGRATFIVDPSKKTPDIQKQQDFLILPNENILYGEINLNQIEKYKQYRIDQGMRAKKIRKAFESFNN